jgi:hypothetical protein
MRSGAAATIALALCLLAPFAGCGSSAAPQGAKTFPVQGKVTYKGQPLKTGSITFEPEGAGRDGHADIQPDGTFVLTTYKNGDGAVGGTHRVAVSNAGKAVPLKYASVSSSKVEIEVSEGKTDYRIELK